MSTDSNEKTQSTFPRSSLRARNRTIVMAPADIDDFRPEQRKTKTSIKLDEIFDESLLASPDLPAETQAEPKQKDTQPELKYSESEQKQEGSEQQLVELEELLPEATAAIIDTSDVSAEDVPGAFDALSEDEFDASSEPDAVSFGDELESASPVGFHGVPEELHDAADSVDAVESVAPVAKIVRAADVGARRIVPAPAVAPDKDVPHMQPVLERSGDVEQMGTVDEEENMEQLLEQEKGRQGEREYLEVKRLSKLVGFLVSYEQDRYGRYIELREGRLLVSSVGQNSDNCLVIEDPSVSPMHAIMRISANGTIMILDQLSEHGTRIKRCGSDKEEALLGDKGTIEHGDVVIFGECGYHVCVLKGI